MPCRSAGTGEMGISARVRGRFVRLLRFPSQSSPSMCSRVSSVPLALLKPTVSSGAAPHGYGVTTDHGTFRQILSRLWPGESLVSAMICSRSRDGRFLIHTPSSRRALLLLSQLPRSSSRAAVASSHFLSSLLLLMLLVAVCTSGASGFCCSEAAASRRSGLSCSCSSLLLPPMLRLP